MPPTLLTVLLALVAAGLLAWFQYFYQAKNKSKRAFILAVLRGISWFCLILLLINPKINKTKSETIRPKLALLLDNSASIRNNGYADTLKRLASLLENNPELRKKFDVESYLFGAGIRPGDSLTFGDRKTNPDAALQLLGKLNKNTNSPLVLLTDGRQTHGLDYENRAGNITNPIYTIVLGDTAVWPDLKIQQVNLNRYAYLDNQFPVEVLSVYEGKTTQNSRLEVRRDGKVLFAQNLNFSAENNSIFSKFYLKASSVGNLVLEIALLPIEGEKNMVNNQKKVALEVINQQSKILLLADFIHPDLGAFKKSIERSKFRKVEIKNPVTEKIDLNDFQMVILYQPNRSFDETRKQIREFNKNTLVVIGSKTDIAYWNTAEPSYRLQEANFSEDIQGSYQASFKTFYVKDIGFDNFPPLKGMMTEIESKVNFDVLLSQKIRGRKNKNPLFATFELAESKHAVLFAENIWRWRAHDFLNQKNFEGFDGFIGNLVQYLSSNQKRERLQLDYETIYESNDNLWIRAGYFDEIFNFDNRAALKITLQNQQSNEQFVFPFLLQKDYYEANLNGIPPGEYKFTVLVEGANLKKEGVFTVLDFDMEKQFSGADYNKLKNVSNQTGGEIFLPDEVQKLIHSLKEDSRFKPVLKEYRSDAPIIDWIWLLILISISLSTEWFLRKYSGLI
ncbi:MAG: hypothetical protein CO119_11430 [Flavobacteriales bacterium CG_4_9_14_3_um_filter_40_17]|nr:MAG: hypothetical protein CO119_11430 [Flavobacteriales bacterium CG_4_9_14_3_um_filter_40_17]